MPKTPIDYSKTIIYRIVCKDLTIKECYVGSTTDFTRRKGNHKSSCNNNNYKEYNYNVYQFIRNNGGWENWDMIEIEKYNTVDKLSQSKRERYWLEYYNATLNKQVPSQNYAEYNKKYREEHKEYYNNYYKENKEILLNQHKEYRKNNKEHILIQRKEYYQINKEQIAENDKEKMTCECGSICRKRDISRHQKSQKHLNFTINAINIGNTTGDIFITTESESDIL